MSEHISAFMGLLDPDDNLTGGGAASAIAGALAGGLVALVSRLKVGKTDLPESDDFYRAVDREMQELIDQLLRASETDTRAYRAVLRAYRLPKNTAARMRIRSQAIQDAMVEATRVPLENAARCVRILERCKTLQGRSDTTATAHLNCAWYLGQAAASGCLTTAKANLPALKIPRRSAEMRRRAERIAHQLRQLTNDH